MTQQKTCLVTGANTGIGRVTARVLAERGWHVFVACRSEEKTLPVVEAIRSETGNAAVEFLPLDLGELGSVRACAKAFLARDVPLSLLINNAGIAGQWGKTKSGFELAFGVNHVGHFLLTTLLLDRIRESAPGRIVTVSSKAHYRARGIDYDAVRRKTRTITAVPEYGVSKLANVLFTAELARRLAGTGITTYSLHPGVVASDVWRTIPRPFSSLMKLAMLSVEDGAKTTLHCALDEAAGKETGLYYDASRVKAASPYALDEKLAAELWRRSEEWVSE